MSELIRDTDPATLKAAADRAASYAAEIERQAELRREIGRQITKTQKALGGELQEVWETTFKDRRLRLSATGAEERHPASIQTFRQEQTDWRPIPRRFRYDSGSEVKPIGALDVDVYDVVDVAEGHAVLERPRHVRGYQFRAPLERIVIIDTEPAELPPVDGAD